MAGWKCLKNPCPRYEVLNGMTVAQLSQLILMEANTPKCSDPDCRIIVNLPAGIDPTQLPQI